MKLHHLFMLLCLGHIGLAEADIYKYVDADGNVTYSSTPLKGGKKLNMEPLPTMAPFVPSSADELRIKQDTQKKRDEARRKILEDEMAKEQKLLDDARQKLQDAKDNPLISHGQDGKTYRNVAQYEENVKTAQDEVALHEKNVEALKTELAGLK